MDKAETTVDPAWFRALRYVWYEVLCLPFAPASVLERCSSSAAGLLTPEQLNHCLRSQSSVRNRLLIGYLLFNGVKLAAFLELLNVERSSDVARILVDTLSYLNENAPGIDKALEVTAAAIGNNLPQPNDGFHREIIRRSKEVLLEQLSTDRVLYSEYLIAAARLGCINDATYVRITHISTGKRAAEELLVEALASEASASVFLAVIGGLNGNLLRFVESRIFFRNNLQALYAEPLRTYIRRSELVYVEEAALSHAFFQRITPLIASNWRDIAYAFKLSRSEVKQIWQRWQVAEGAAQEMLLIVERNLSQQAVPAEGICLNALLQALEKADLKEKACNIRAMFNEGTFQQQSLSAKQEPRRNTSVTEMQIQPGLGQHAQGSVFVPIPLPPLGLPGQQMQMNANFQVVLQSSPQGLLAVRPNVSQAESQSVRSQQAQQSPQPATAEQGKGRRARKTKKKATKGGMSEETWQSYQEALKGGRRTVLHERAIICGAGRVGKTSFRRSLHDEQFKEVIDSTIGVELHKVVCTAKRDSETNIWTWKEVKSEDEQQMLLTAKALTEEVKATRQQAQTTGSTKFSKDQVKSSPLQASASTATSSPAKQDTTVADIGHSPATPSCGQQASGNRRSRTASLSEVKTQSPTGGGEPSFKPELIAGYHDKISAQVRQLLDRLLSGTMKDFLNTEDDFCFVDVWDFAGQEAFVVIQHMLLAELRCAYVAMFNSKLPLSKHTAQLFCHGGQEHEVDSDQDATNFDMLESWLNVIHQVAGGNPDVPVYVVGSHADQLTEEKEKEIEDYLWRNIEGKAYFSNVDGIVFIDNTLSGSGKVDAGVQKLRNLLIEKMLKQKAMQLPIPLSWLPFTLIARLLAKENGLPWLTMDEVMVVADTVCNMSSPADISNLLQFHHALGHVLHYPDNPDLSDRAIINVEWLLRVVSRIFIPLPPGEQDKHFRTHYALLHHRGILLESLAQHIWEQDPDIAKHTKEQEHRRFLFHLMEEFSLLYDTKEEKSFEKLKPQRYFYVPALARHVPDSQHTASKEDVEESTPLFLYSGTNQLFPQSLFWCLVVRFMRKYSPSADPILHRNSARIACRGVFKTVLQYFQQGIKITVERENAAMAAGSTEGLTVKDFCVEVLPFIENQLTEVKGDTLKHFEWQRAARCPCSINSEQCRKHGQQHCSHVSCHHFVIFKDGETLHCSHPTGFNRGQDVYATVSVWPCWDPQDAADEMTLQASEAELPVACKVGATITSHTVSVVTSNFRAMLIPSEPCSDVDRDAKPTPKQISKVARRLQSREHWKSLALELGLEFDDLDMCEAKAKKHESEFEGALEALRAWTARDARASIGALWDALHEISLPNVASECLL